MIVFQMIAVDGVIILVFIPQQHALPTWPLHLVAVCHQWSLVSLRVVVPQREGPQWPLLVLIWEHHLVISSISQWAVSPVLPLRTTTWLEVESHVTLVVAIKHSQGVLMWWLMFVTIKKLLVSSGLVSREYTLWVHHMDQLLEGQ